MSDLIKAIEALTNILASNGMVAVAAILFVLFVAYFIHSSRKQDRKDKEHREELKQQRDEYAKLLEERHTQFIGLMKDNGEVLEEINKQMGELEKVVEIATETNAKVNDTMQRCKYAKAPKN